MAGMEKIENYIGDAFVPPHSGEYLENIEPATGRAYSLVAASDARDVDRAVEEAEQAFSAWMETPTAKRSEYLLAIANAIEERLEEFARAESIDTGKPIQLARTVDIPRAVSNFRFFGTAILHTANELHETDQLALNITLRTPRGVAGLISPWNLPLYLLSWKIAPALASGNTAVAKPSEITPRTADLLAHICKQIKLPRGVLNIVHGTGAKAGARVVAHPAVKAISFTGGTATGREIARVASSSFKRVSLELGGKNANIVFADVELNRVVSESVRAAFSNQGQICLSGSRILVEEGVFDQFVKEFVTQTSKLRLGDPLLPETEQGALVSRMQLEKVEEYVKLANLEGGNIVSGGKRPSMLPERVKNGFFFEPTVITGLGPASRVNCEEIFGPVVTITPFTSDEQAIDLANGTEYGLAASIWTNQLKRAHAVARALHAGTVWVNCWMLRDLRVPFGGVKHSGVGREGGDEALHFFTEPKNVCFRY